MKKYKKGENQYLNSGKMNKKTDKTEKLTQQITSASQVTPTSILRVSGSYRSNQLTNNPSITINVPTDAASSNAEEGNDASDAQAQQQRRQRREQFEQLRRNHYHNMYSSISGHRHSSATAKHSAVERESKAQTESSKSSNQEQDKEKK